ncbi:MAG: S1 domain-containing protein [Deltaproteobacteria bacterium]|nr:S1 domain-containing protein [Deltaproteobacteria bacterium]MBI4795210.1 S1 domain-containing protein [Deltaproteobacteria bacterium]
MKKIHFLTACLMVSLLGWWQLPQAGAQGRGQGFRPCPYTPYTCPVKAICKAFDESGKVAQVLTETLEPGMYPGMAVVVDTKKQGRVHVSLGPVWYLERQEFELRPGDEVRVKGMCEKEKNGKLRVVAYELVKGDHVLLLRDSLGRPNWEAWRKRGN